MTTISLLRETSTASRPATAASRFIVSPRYDILFFILSPLLAVGFGELIEGWVWAMTGTPILGIEQTPVLFLIAVMTNGHLFAVFFRSHANPEIRVRHPIRFWVVPAALFVAFMTSIEALVTGVVLVVFWDFYHSAMQNFGFCRIYDSRRGNDPERMRRLDYWLNVFLYLGPFYVGASFLPILDTFAQFADIGWILPLAFAGAVKLSRPYLIPVVIAAGVLFSIHYLRVTWQAMGEGYRLSWQKSAFIASTAVTCIWAFGFMPVWKAYVVTNFFHALQYFAIVWIREKRSIRRVFGLGNTGLGEWVPLSLFVATVALVGVTYWVHGDHGSLRWAQALAVICSLLHFWYDGFIWSVRRREV